VLGLFPFSVLGTIITVNNFLAAAVLGPPLLYLVYPRVKEMGLLYPDVMREDDLPDVAPSQRQLAATGIVVVSIAWVAVGIAISVGVEGTQFLATTGETFGQGGSITQQVLGAVGLLALLGLTAISGDSLSEMIRR